MGTGMILEHGEIQVNDVEVLMYILMVLGTGVFNLPEYQGWIRE